MTLANLESLDSKMTLVLGLERMENTVETSASSFWKVLIVWPRIMLQRET
jgi:hypothetical protein